MVSLPDLSAHSQAQPEPNWVAPKAATEHTAKAVSHTYAAYLLAIQLTCWQPELWPDAVNAARRAAAGWTAGE
jgi:hypothetical protein